MKTAEVLELVSLLGTLYVGLAKISNLSEEQLEAAFQKGKSALSSRKVIDLPEIPE